MYFSHIATFGLLAIEAYAATSSKTTRRTRIRTKTKTSTVTSGTTTTSLLLPSGLVTDLSASVMGVNGQTATYLVAGGLFDDDVTLTVTQGEPSNGYGPS